MYTFTNEQFEILKRAWGFIPCGESFNALPKADQDLIIEAEIVLLDVIKQKKAKNAKFAEYVAGKRKIDKNFARPKKNNGRTL